VEKSLLNTNTFNKSHCVSDTGHLSYALQEVISSEYQGQFDTHAFIQDPSVTPQ